MERENSTAVTRIERDAAEKKRIIGLLDSCGLIVKSIELTVAAEDWHGQPIHEQSVAIKATFKAETFPGS